MPDNKLIAECFAALGKSFRGEIYDNARRYQLVGKAYEAMPAEQNGYFDIASARHLAGPLRAFLNPNIRHIYVRKAVQTQGSVILDLCLHYVLEHVMRNTLVLFEDDPKAKLYAKVRLMDTIRAHPVLSQMAAESKEVDRHNMTGTQMKFGWGDVLIGGMNDGNCSSLSWPIVLISEAWMAKSNGLLWKAFGRTTQFEHDCKVLVESQAGNEGEDWHRACNTATRIPLLWDCPYCGGAQEWDFMCRRPDDFTHRTPVAAPDGWEPPKPGSFAGMRFDGHERTEPDGKVVPLTIDQRAKSAYWECYHCGCAIRDSRAVRKQIMDTYQQPIPEPAPKAVMFDWPEEASLNISFEESARHFLIAEEAQKSGNMVPKADWYMQRRGKTWSLQNERPQAFIETGLYAPQDGVADELERVMAVDVQQDPTLSAEKGTNLPGHFWWTVRVITKTGDLYQVARGYAMGWDELQRVQDQHKVINPNVGIDVGKWLNDVADQAAARMRPYVVRTRRHGKWVQEKRGFTWTLLRGDDGGPWKWPDGRLRAIKSPVAVTRKRTVNNHAQEVSMQMYSWSNLHIKDQLNRLRAGGDGMVKFVSLAPRHLDDATRAREQNNLTYDNQMQSEWRTEKGGKPYWDKVAESRPNHYWDVECMALVMLGIKGHLGVAAAEDVRG